MSGRKLPAGQDDPAKLSNNLGQDIKIAEKEERGRGTN